MPTHIDVLCGDYRAVVETNHAAIEADRKFMEREGSINFYSLYRCHNYHFKMHGAMFLGQYRPAIASAEEMITTLPEELLAVRSPPMVDWLVSNRFIDYRNILGNIRPHHPGRNHLSARKTPSVRVYVQELPLDGRRAHGGLADTVR